MGNSCCETCQVSESMLLLIHDTILYYAQANRPNRLRLIACNFIKYSSLALISSFLFIFVRYYICCDNPYPDITFTLKIKRNAGFYNFVLTTTSVLLSSLTLLIFLMPRNSADRNSFGKLFSNISIYSKSY